VINGKRLRVDVTGFDVKVVEGFQIKWQGRPVDTGPVTVELGEPGSYGIIDYETGIVDVEFRVQISFPELAEILDDLGAEPGISAPAPAIIRSQGSVFEDDHSLRLAGKGQFLEHRLFDPEETRISIRAPSQ